MTRRISAFSTLMHVIALWIWLTPAVLWADDLSAVIVKEAIDRGVKYLIKEQSADGSWRSEPEDNTTGVTSLCILALINSGLTPKDAPVRKGLQYLRSNSTNFLQNETYQVSLAIMAFAAAKDGAADKVRIATLAQRLEQGQLKRGPYAGGWDYRLGDNTSLRADNSNTQFAILGLREAVDSGAIVSRETWQLCREHWEVGQNGDGGWSYTNSRDQPAQGGSYGSMTVAGVSSLAICEQMLRSDDGVSEDGIPPCCAENPSSIKLENGLKWLGRQFAVGQNPGRGGNLLYYIYGLERAGRLSGRRFLGDHDWYREGTDFLIRMQNKITGHFPGVGHGEESPITSTTFALLFLSKGLSPVLVNKLKFGPRDPLKPLDVVGDGWNQHRRDVRNLTEHISGLPKWPKLVTSQEVDIARAVKTDGVNSLLQAPVLFITNNTIPKLSPDEVKLLKEYIQEGGFIFATPTCKAEDFESGFRELCLQLFPPGEGELRLLPPDHPVFRSEYLLTPFDSEHPEGLKMYGVDFGCRTSVIYVPEDLGCYWDYWMRVEPPKRNFKFKQRIARAVDIGVNVMAYATGREPPSKTDVPKKVADNIDLDNVERGLLQVAQIKHDGSWNAAPRALRNLLLALNQTSGLAASTKTTELSFGDPNVFRYPILYMHGRNKFGTNERERQQLKEYIQRGGVLFVDSCCGSKPFDKSLREMISATFSDIKLEPIAPGHELYSEAIGHDIRKVRLRTQETNRDSAAASMMVRETTPLLEGLEIDGRLAVIYSRYDISCALERQSAGNCEGYVPEDAVKIAMNIILYSMLQDLRYSQQGEQAPPKNDK